ncbi:dethiobiotin synthase [Corallincola luteus]|uniref:ATP-dependent dethiobiotin synthetase BioD n=1 Tax=Corallincola luteus TaxID=1775177 RepID=A0ABY2AK33_9GAMM|nr:dethiobiotin synthase [Corallincola luteus]TCI03197.1 dethiobiotin synthase [Corallincola luteus]
MKTVFITGTDTDAGKTFTSVQLIHWWQNQGLSVAVSKPVAAGGTLNPAGRLENEDALALMAATQLETTYQAVNPYCFNAPASPHISAAQDNAQVSLAELQQHHQDVIAKRGADICLVEGAGGWMVPINDSELLSGLPITMRWPVILVVGMKLGCLNHALLTAAQIKAQGGHLVGWIANSPLPEMEFLAENIDTLASLIDAPLIGTIGYQQTEVTNFDLVL